MSSRDAGRSSAALHPVVSPAGPSTTRWQLSADHHLSRRNSVEVSQSRLRDQSREVKFALVLNQLRDGDVLDRDGVVRIGCDHRVPIAIVMGGCQQRLEIRKDRVIDLDHVRVGVEIGNGFVAEIGREHERVASVGADSQML
jgi:hypothetical protein